VSFLFDINDIAFGLSSTTRLFVDDIMLYLTVQNNREADLLQRESTWETTWRMEFHPNKCEVISLSHKPEKSDRLSIPDTWSLVIILSRWITSGT